MPVTRKQELVALIERAGIPLIEDDVYGDLAGEGQRPPACKAFDQSGSVIYCSSLSKTPCPGLENRVGCGRTLSHSGIAGSHGRGLGWRTAA